MDLQFLWGTVRSRGSSVSIVSWLQTRDRAIRFRSPAEAKDISFSLCVQNKSEVHPASYPMGTGVRGSKARPGRDADYSPHLLPRSWISRNCNSFSPCRLHGGSGTALLFIVTARMWVDKSILSGHVCGVSAGYLRHVHVDVCVIRILNSVVR
jgi:hypothetical protein